MKNLFILIVVFIATVSHACDKPEILPNNTFPEILITTSMGVITLELDRNRAPITVNNFLQYIQSGNYKNTIFHRVEKDFVIQGGGYDKKFNDISQCQKIFNESGNGLKNTTGTIAMARYGNPHSATSQFYFNLSDNESLDPNVKNWGYTVFGEVLEGMDVLIAISEVNVGYSSRLDSSNVPIEPILIKSIVIK